MVVSYLAGTGVSDGRAVAVTGRKSCRGDATGIRIEDTRSD